MIGAFSLSNDKRHELHKICCIENGTNVLITAIIVDISIPNFFIEQVVNLKIFVTHASEMKPLLSRDRESDFEKNVRIASCFLSYHSTNSI